MIYFILDFLGEYWEAIIALCALSLTIIEFSRARKHDRISVRPHLSASSFYTVENNEFHFQLKLKNVGLGPAKIEKMGLFFDNKIITENDIENFQNKTIDFIFKKFGKIDCGVFTLAKGSIIAINEELEILDLHALIEDPENIESIKNNLFLFRLNVEYTSFYGTKYLMKNEILK